MRRLLQGVCLLLAVGGLVLMTLQVVSGAENRKLLGAGLLCTSSGSVVNLIMLRNERRKKEKEDND